VKLNDFDRVAFIYDFLAKLVFGKEIQESQKYFLGKIYDHSKVLVLGGGSGWLLAELLKAKPNCEIDYVEASERMIALTKKKVKNEDRVHLIHGTEEDISLAIKYDAVITNFYLDLFTMQQLDDVLKKIQSSIKSGGLWIVTDFVDNKKWWQSILLKLMYWFFRITCGLEMQQLPEWNKSMEKIELKEVESKFFYNGFIKTAVFQI
jgi:ubiquinone/menaquinone biosynthesis C-methylase UbiE